MQTCWLEKDMPKIKLREVFAPGGMPSVTYVGREHLRLEERITRAVARAYSFNVVTGPTKSGKSVLCHKVLDKSKLVTLEGGQITSDEDFWDQLAHRMQVAAGVTKTERESEVISGEVSAGWNLGGLLKLKARADVGSGRDSTKSALILLSCACLLMLF